MESKLANEDKLKLELLTVLWLHERKDISGIAFGDRGAIHSLRKKSIELFDQPALQHRADNFICIAITLKAVMRLGAFTAVQKKKTPARRTGRGFGLSW